MPEVHHLISPHSDLNSWQMFFLFTNKAAQRCQRACPGLNSWPQLGLVWNCIWLPFCTWSMWSLLLCCFSSFSEVMALGWEQDALHPLVPYTVTLQPQNSSTHKTRGHTVGGNLFIESPLLGGGLWGCAGDMRTTPHEDFLVGQGEGPTVLLF